MSTNIVDLQPGFIDAMHAYEDGRLQEARTILEALLEGCPDGAPHWFALLGNLHFKAGRPEQAADAYVRESGLSPDRAPAFLKLAVTLYAGIACHEKLTAIGPRAVALNPGNSAIAYAVAGAFNACGRAEEAAPYVALLDPHNPQQVAFAVGYHRSTGALDLSYARLQDGIRDCPDDWYLKILRYAEARSICDFDALRDHETIMQTPDSPEAAILLSGESALLRLYWNESETLNARPSRDSLGLQATMAAHTGRMPRRTISPPAERLRIGYLSNDFCQHAVMTVFNDILLQHDRTAFDITLFCYTEPRAAAYQQAWPESLRNAVVRIGDLSSTNAAAAIRDHGIDILVDLKGHTLDARLDIVNLSDAPIKVSYLGYPAPATGVALDYAITDRFITPDSSIPFYPEKLCRLPGTSMPNSALSKARPQPCSRADWGLPDDRFIFCSFNAVYKISTRTIAAWGRILAAAPETILWIRCDGDFVRGNLLAELRRHGVGRERIIFATGTASYQDHVNRLALADVSLDTMPYNGHVTTTDMLRAGLPVVAVRGSNCASRMTEGLLHVFGMPELIAEDDNGYCRLAIELATDPALAAATRQKLLQRRETTALFDPAGFARTLERAFTMMAARARAGLPPDHIDVPAF